MPRFEPFAAVRYAPGLPLADVTAPPYDVLSADDVERWRGRHPANIVRIDVPRDQDGTHRYADAAAQLAAWRADGTLLADRRPSFTLYRMRFVDESGRHRATVGVLGALEVVDEGADGVLPHERTTPKAKTDRLDLTRATSANLSPVWGLSLTPGLTDLLDAPGEPLGSFVDEDGVEHSVERVDEPERVDAIRRAVGAAAVLIADGHHRYAISRTFRDEVRRAGNAATDAETTLAYVAELVDEQLSIDAIHRVYRGPSGAGLLEHLRPWFTCTEAGPIDSSFARQVVERGALCFVRPDRTGVWLTPDATRFAGVRQLDGALLEAALDGVEGLDVGYQHGVAQTVELVASGAADAAVLIRPTGIDEIRRTATERLLMPPKSTFFTPKLRTGLVIRPLDLG